MEPVTPTLAGMGKADVEPDWRDGGAELSVQSFQSNEQGKGESALKRAPRPRFLFPRRGLTLLPPSPRPRFGNPTDELSSPELGLEHRGRIKRLPLLARPLPRGRGQRRDPFVRVFPVDALRGLFSEELEEEEEDEVEEEEESSSDDSMETALGLHGSGGDYKGAFDLESSIRVAQFPSSSFVLVPKNSCCSCSTPS